jgi:hypothetical protein
MNAMRLRGLVVWALLLAAAAPLTAAETVYRKTLRGTAMVTADDSQGTAWVVNRDKRLLVTCQHVVGEATKVRVMFPAYRDGRVVTRRDFYDANGVTVSGRVLRADAERDLALIELESLPDGVGELPLAAEAPDPGDAVHTVGCPARTKALWVYSGGRVRSVSDAEWTDDTLTRRAAQVVESQVPINPGDSGGPLVNDKGEVVGVNHGRQEGVQLISLAIASDEVKKFLAEPRPAAKKAPAGEDYLRAAREFRAKKEWDKAADNYRKAIEARRDNVKAHAELAWVLNEQGKHDEAILTCLIALLIDEKCGDAWRESGYAYWKTGELARAEEALERARDINPADGSAKRYLEEVRLARKKAEEEADDKDEDEDKD